MSREDVERVNTDAASPSGEHEPSRLTKPSPPPDEAPDSQPGSEAEEGDPEAPPWNFLFVFPAALLALLALIALVMFFGR